VLALASHPAFVKILSSLEFDPCCICIACQVRGLVAASAVLGRTHLPSITATRTQAPLKSCHPANKTNHSAGLPSTIQYNIVLSASTTTGFNLQMNSRNLNIRAYSK
jgi:hypothetical protein